MVLQTVKGQVEFFFFYMLSEEWRNVRCRLLITVSVVTGVVLWVYSTTHLKEQIFNLLKPTGYVTHQQV